MSHCAKCDGLGTISAYSHIAAGRCFTCGGTGRHAGPVTEMEAVYSSRTTEAVWFAYASDAGFVIARTSTLQGIAGCLAPHYKAGSRANGGEFQSADSFSHAEAVKLAADIEAYGTIDTRRPFWA